MQARIFLEGIFAPYMEGICKSWGVSPEEGLRILIKEEITFGKIAKENPEALAELLNQREIKMMVDIASPLKDVSDEWVNEKMDILFKVMHDIKPGLAGIIVETPEGKAWFHDSMTSLKNILFGVPTLSPMTE